MNPSKFNEIIKNRAQANVERKITQFKQDVGAAIERLTGRNPIYSGYVNPFLAPGSKEYLEQLLKEKLHSGWPSELWRTEESKVATALLDVMDEMQKALMEPKVTAQYEPVAEEEKKQP